MKPTKEARYLTVAHLLALYHQVMERTGFRSAPVRDERLLESAVMRPQMAAHYEGADLVRQSALLAVAIAQAQAFLDGNKRTAFAALRVFLRANGLTWTGDPIELAQQLEAVAMRPDSLDAATDRFEQWLREHIVPAG